MRRDLRWPVRAGIVGLVCLVAIGIALYEIHRRAIYVDVINETSDVLLDVDVQYRGGRANVSRIEPGKHAGFYVHPSTETHLTFTCATQHSGILHSETDTYLEPGYRGDVALIVTKDGVIARQNVTISLLP